MRLFYREKETIYQLVGEDGKVTFTIHPTEGAERVTVWLPPKHSIKIGKDGQRYIECPDGSTAQDFDGGAAYTGRPSITHISPKTKKIVRQQCDLLDSASYMRVIAYRSYDIGRKKNIIVRWSIHEEGKCEAIPIYLPAWCKLVVDKESGARRIQLPENGTGETKVFRDGRFYLPAEPSYANDFSGVGKDGIPFLMLGSKRRPCFLSHTEDIYTPRMASKSITRLDESLWRIDEYIRDEETETGYILRSFSETKPE